MIYWAMMFLAVSLISGFFGFGGLTDLSGGVAKFLSAVFFALFLLTLLWRFLTRS